MSLFGTAPSDDEEARRFFDRFVADGPARLAWFTDEVQRLAGRSPQPVVEDVDWVAPGVVQRLATPGEVEAPRWFSAAFARQGWTAYGAALADGLVHLVAELYHRELGARWRLEPDPGHANHRRPVMDVPGVTPPWRLVPVLVQVQEGRQPPGAVAAAVRTVLAGAGRRPGPGPLLVTVSDSRRDGFDHEVHLDEAAESVLGREVFQTLGDRLAAIPGVEDLLWEDRELFLLRAPDLPGAVLQDLVRRAVGQA